MEPSAVMTVEEYAAGLEGRDRTALSRALTLVESRRHDHRRQAQALLERILPQTGGATRVGISGVPGAGKSTLIEALGLRLVEQGHRVAVLAVDPTSTVSGGSILGDKTRMAGLANHPRAFVRPSPTGGSLGGVARTSREVMLVLEAAGHDVILVETVGVGQSEIAVSRMVDTFVVLLVAGTGDELQGIKRGILELADLVAVNKVDVDRARAEGARRDFAAAVALLQGEHDWVPRVLGVSAATGEGLDRLWETVQRHRTFLEADGRLEARRRDQRVQWMWDLVNERLVETVRQHPAVREHLVDLEGRVGERRTTPALAAEEILRAAGLDEE